MGPGPGQKVRFESVCSYGRGLMSLRRQEGREPTVHTGHSDLDRQRGVPSTPTGGENLVLGCSKEK